MRTDAEPDAVEAMPPEERCRQLLFTFWPMPIDRVTWTQGWTDNLRSVLPNLQKTRGAFARALFAGNETAERCLQVRNTARAYAGHLEDLLLQLEEEHVATYRKSGRELESAFPRRMRPLVFAWHFAAESRGLSSEELPISHGTRRDRPTSVGSTDYDPPASATSYVYMSCSYVAFELLCTRVCCVVADRRRACLEALLPGPGHRARIESALRDTLNSCDDMSAIYPEGRAPAFRACQMNRLRMQRLPLQLQRWFPQLVRLEAERELERCSIVYAPRDENETSLECHRRVAHENFQMVLSQYRSLTCIGQWWMQQHSFLNTVQRSIVGYIYDATLFDFWMYRFFSVSADAAFASVSGDTEAAVTLLRWSTGLHNDLRQKDFVLSMGARMTDRYQSDLQDLETLLQMAATTSVSSISVDEAVRWRAEKVDPEQRRRPESLVAESNDVYLDRARDQERRQRERMELELSSA